MQQSTGWGPCAGEGTGRGLCNDEPQSGGGLYKCPASGHDLTILITTLLFSSCTPQTHYHHNSHNPLPIVIPIPTLPAALMHRSDHDIFQTFEGDNTVLMQQVGGGRKEGAKKGNTTVRQTLFPQAPQVLKGSPLLPLLPSPRCPPCCSRSTATSSRAHRSPPPTVSLPR